MVQKCGAGVNGGKNYYWRAGRLTAAKTPQGRLTHGGGEEGGGGQTGKKYHDGRPMAARIQVNMDQIPS